MAALEKAGYVRVTKGRVGRRARTWLALTGNGKQAFARHLAVLNQIAAEPPRPPEEE